MSLLARLPAAAILLAFPATVKSVSAETCPAPLEGALRLVLVTADGMDRKDARLRLYERDSAGSPWKPAASGEPVVIGRNGLAWGHPFLTLAAPGEPVKREGDGRSPAGIYRIGRSFGFAATPRPEHLVLKPGRTLCVDDPSSADYNRIVPMRAGLKGEDMGAEPLYRRGLVIDYPSDAGARAGSCIFLHVWRGRAKGTAGCVAMPERRVKAIQDFAEAGAAIAMLPREGLARFGACLPAVGP